MKKILILILIFIGTHTFAQDSLKIFKAERMSTTSNGMAVLGGWGVANIGVGTYGWLTSKYDEPTYFHQMNVLWGVVNFGRAIITYDGAQKYRRKNLTAAQTLHEQQRIEHVFRNNRYWDLGFIGAGLYLKLVGDSRKSPIMKGFGESTLMQGGFLLIFDQLMYNAEKRNGSKLTRFLEKNPITFDGKRVGMVFNM